MSSIQLDAPGVEFVDVAGYRMAYRQWGDATARRALVLIHGITSSSLSWVRVAPRLSATWRVIAVDLKGHGDSDRPAEGYRIEDQAAEVAGLVRELELQDVSVIGHSWGGRIALYLATRGGLTPRRLVLEDPGGLRGHLSPDEQRQQEQSRAAYVESVGLSEPDARARFQANLDQGWTPEDVAGKVDAAVKGSPAAVRAVFEANGWGDMAPLLGDLRCPTLLLRAELARGGIVGDEAVRAAEANPLIKVVTVPDADHNIHRGRFDAFMRIVEPFLEV